MHPKNSNFRQLRQCLSLVIISKLLDEKREDIPNVNNLQVEIALLFSFNKWERRIEKNDGSYVKSPAVRA